MAQVLALQPVAVQAVYWQWCWWTAIFTIFNERKLVLELLRVVKVTVTVTMKKFEIASIARWLVLLLGTYRYWTRQTNIVKKRPNIVQYCPILSNIDQYCSVLFNIVQVTISAGSDQSYIIVRNIRKLSNIGKYILILLGIDLYCLALTKYSPVVPCLDIFPLKVNHFKPDLDVLKNRLYSTIQVCKYAIKS